MTSTQQIPFVLPDLIAIQRESFLSFLEHGIGEELASLDPVIGQGFSITFLRRGYRLRRPTLSLSQSILHASSYASSLYARVQVRDPDLREEDVFLTDLPLMTDRGHFVINGSSRVVVNQIVRSPGIYFKEMLDARNRRTFQASIISNRGSWIRVETDRDGMIWARMDKAKKVSILVLLQAMGLSQKTIFRSLRSPQFMLQVLDSLFTKKRWQTKPEQLVPMSTESALLELHSKLCPDRPATVASARQVLHGRFMDPKRYDLGVVGRMKMNHKLRLSVPEHHHTLRPVDLLATTDYLIGLEYGRGVLDDIDHLKNRRVRCAGELVQTQLRVGLLRLERLMQSRVARQDSDQIPPLASLVNPKPIIGALREFFGSSPLSQFMDQTNPLAEITHKRRLSSLGPGGISKDRASMAVREIHPSQYGRICPIETPEGPNAGLIGSMATYARVNEHGLLESPFYQVVGGRVLHQHGPVFLTAEQEDEVHVAAGDVLSLPTLPDHSLVMRYRQEFHTGRGQEVDYVGIAPTQMISVATSLIPFLEHDDANRALMGSNMQRQAVPLLQAECPLVGTGLEAQAALDSGSVVRATVAGVVNYVDAARVSVAHQEAEAHHFLQVYRRSNQGTCIHQRPAVHLGAVIHRGDLLADGSATMGGQLALGKNLLVAYMPWEGYNFEDAILVSERLVYDDLYSSLHMERYEIETQQTKLGVERITRALGIEDDSVRWLDEDGMVTPGAWVGPGDVLVGKVTPKEEKDLTPEARLLHAIFGEKPRDVRDTSLRVPQGVRGRVVDVRVIRDDETTLVHVYLCEQRRIQVGDKMAGRHGNKGIVSRILPRQDMPYLQDGTPVDMVLNPLGVPSRMNVGQVFECLLGLAGQVLGQQFKIRAFDEMYGAESSRGLVYSKLYEARQATGHHWLFNPDHPGKSRLVDGRTGDAFDQPVTVGKAYMLKLVHQVDDKIHARSTGPYSLITQQPLGGRSRKGGQRLGEMEVWALEGFGAAYVLQELLTVKSDDMHGRNETMNAIIQAKRLPQTGTPESFKVLVRELQSLCLNIGIHCRGDDYQIKETDLMHMS